MTIWLKNFFVVKSPMGAPLESKNFTHQKKNQFHLLLGRTRAKKKSCWKLDIGYLVPICFSPLNFLIQIKSLVGLRFIQSSKLSRRDWFIGQIPGKCFFRAEIWAASCLWVGGSLVREVLVVLKTPIGVETFEFWFF